MGILGWNGLTETAEPMPQNGHAEAIGNLKRQVDRLEAWQQQLGPADELRETLKRLDGWREESRRNWWATAIVLTALAIAAGFAVRAYLGTTINRALSMDAAIPTRSLAIRVPAVERIAQLRIAIRRLPTDDPQHWTADGRPRLDAITHQAPMLAPIAREERDYAWMLERVASQ